MKTSEELLAKEAAFDGDGRFELADSTHRSKTVAVPAPNPLVGSSQVASRQRAAGLTSSGRPGPRQPRQPPAKPQPAAAPAPAPRAAPRGPRVARRMPASPAPIPEMWSPGIHASHADAPDGTWRRRRAATWGLFG